MTRQQDGKKFVLTTPTEIILIHSQLIPIMVMKAFIQILLAAILKAYIMTVT
jgi:hypothetical protein